MRSSRTAAGLVPALLLSAGLAACSSSSTSGHGGTSSGTAGSTASTPSTGSSSPTASSGGASTPATSTPATSAPATSAPATTASTPAGGSDVTAAALAARLRTAMVKVRSLHISLSTKAGAATVTAAGDEAVAGGKVTGLDLSESFGSQHLRIIYAGGTAYVQLPAALRKSAKPFSLVSAANTNPTVQALAKSLGSTLNSSSVTSYNTLVQAASSVRSHGRTTVAGQQVTHYSLVIDVAKLPSTLPNGSALQSSGLKTLPLEMYLDSQGRPVEITEQLAISGQHASVQVLVTRYNQTVHIAAPPASQVDRTK